MQPARVVKERLWHDGGPYSGGKLSERGSSFRHELQTLAADFLSAERLRSVRWSLRAFVMLQMFVVLNCATVARQDSSPAAVSRYVRGDTRSENVVVFVHGVFGDAVSTWTNPVTNAYWPELLTKDAA